ncbi:MAG: hypothetical protein P4M11_12075 [Candidatus Pacebacteria bacterium]|nr:hypothetical protein [Candidatus Paceibacterota bacterium]
MNRASALPRQQVSAFRSEIYAFFLCFRNPESEAAYLQYRLHERKIPDWLKWLMWIYLTILVLRRVELLILAALGVNSTATTIAVEIITVSVLISALLIEGMFILFERLVPLKGFAILVASFFIIAHSSHEYYPDRPAIITMLHLNS